MNIFSIFKKLFQKEEKTQPQPQQPQSKYFTCPMCGWKYYKENVPDVCRNHRCGIRF